MRLNSCGLDYCFYIVEGPLIAPSQQSFVNSNSLKSAVVATEIESGMHVLRTRNGDHTASMLRAHHERLTRRFRAGQCGVEFPSYPSFQQRCGKQQIKTTGELFLHVLRMVPGCSTAAALTLQKRFGTVSALVEFLETTEPHAAKVSCQSSATASACKWLLRATCHLQVVACNLLSYIYWLSPHYNL